jgi:MFS family permease
MAADGDRGGRRVRSRLARLAIDLTPLRASRDFRRLWWGLFVSELGYQLARVAIYVQVQRLTGSAAAVGLVGLTGLLAAIAGAVVAGAFVDAHDRRALLLWSQIAFALAAGILVAGAVSGSPPLALILGANAVTSFVAAIEGPTRNAMTPRLVGKDLVPSALALNQVLWQIVSIAGPALGGLVIAWGGFAWAYGLDLVTYAALFVAALGMRPMPPEHDAASAFGIEAATEGFRYVAKNRLLQSTFVIDLVAMIFGMPAALFPLLAFQRFHGGDAVVGLLFAAPAVGALLQSLAGGWTRRVRRHGEIVIWSVLGWGAAIVAFGAAGSNLPLALACLAAAGAADVVSAIFRSTILQTTVPDRLRGRLGAIFFLVVTGGPRLGDFEAGVVASVVSPTFSIVSGGAACLAGAVVVAIVYPELRRYRA